MRKRSYPNSCCSDTNNAWNYFLNHLHLLILLAIFAHKKNESNLRTYQLVVAQRLTLWQRCL